MVRGKHWKFAIPSTFIYIRFRLTSSRSTSLWRIRKLGTHSAIFRLFHSHHPIRALTKLISMMYGLAKSHCKSTQAGIIPPHLLMFLFFLFFMDSCGSSGSCSPDYYPQSRVFLVPLLRPFLRRCQTLFEAITPTPAPPMISPNLASTPILVPSTVDMLMDRRSGIAQVSLAWYAIKYVQTFTLNTGE